MDGRRPRAVARVSEADRRRGILVPASNDAPLRSLRGPARTRGPLTLVRASVVLARYVGHRSVERLDVVAHDLVKRRRFRAMPFVRTRAGGDDGGSEDHAPRRATRVPLAVRLISRETACSAWRTAPFRPRPPRLIRRTAQRLGGARVTPSQPLWLRRAAPSTRISRQFAGPVSRVAGPRN